MTDDPTTPDTPAPAATPKAPPLEQFADPETGQPLFRQRRTPAPATGEPAPAAAPAGGAAYKPGDRVTVYGYDRTADTPGEPAVVRAGPYPTAGSRESYTVVCGVDGGNRTRINVPARLMKPRGGHSQSTSAAPAGGADAAPLTAGERHQMWHSAQWILNRGGSAGTLATEQAHHVKRALAALAAAAAERDAATAELETSRRRWYAQQDEWDEETSRNHNRLVADLDAARREAAGLRARVEHLLDVLHRDQTGLAAGLAEVVKLVRGWDWVTEGRGPYEWDDDEYRAEMGRMLKAIGDAAKKALTDSGSLAHRECCGRGLDAALSAAPAADEPNQSKGQTR